MINKTCWLSPGRLFHTRSAMSVLVAASVGLAYGVLHGLGPDHLAALASLVVNSKGIRRALSVSLSFGLAHAICLGSLACVAGISGWLLPPALQRGAEILGGGLLVGLGFVVAVRATSRPARVGTASALGGLFALSGARGLILALPPLLLAGRGIAHAMAYVLAFGVGVAASMVAFGLTFCALLKKCHGRAGGWASRAVGLVSIGLGLWWMWHNT